MNDPWQLFGLDANRCTVPELKKAYARLLRENRPDEDPAGFQAVHQAYQRALKLLSLRGPVPPDHPLETTAVEGLQTGVQTPISNFPLFEEWEESEEEAWDDEPEPNPELRDILIPPPQTIPVIDSISVPPACMKELAELEFVLGSEPRRAHLSQNRMKIIRACAQVSHALSAAGIRADRRAQMWASVLGDDLQRIAKPLQSSLFLGLIRLDEIGFCQRVTRQWQAQGNRPCLIAVAKLLTEVKANALTDESASLLVDLALEIAVEDPVTAEKLSSSAYSHYGPSNRYFVPSRLDNQIWLGRQVLLLPKRFRKVWASWLRQNKLHLDTKTPQVFGIIYATADVAPFHWAGWTVVHPRLSAELQGFVDRCLASKANGSVFSRLHSKDYLPLAKQSFRFVAKSFIHSVLMIFFFLFTVFSLCDGARKLYEGGKKLHYDIGPWSLTFVIVAALGYLWLMPKMLSK